MMFKIFRKTFVLIILLVFVLNLFAMPVLAVIGDSCKGAGGGPDQSKCSAANGEVCDPDSLICVQKSATTSGGSVKFDNPISSPTIQALIASITNWLINIGLAIAVLMLIYGALVFITAGGVPDKITQGKKILTWSVIGLATLLLAKGAEFVIRSFLA